MRMVLESPATPGLPISMLLMPVVTLKPALLPSAMLKLPVVFPKSACAAARAHPQWGGYPLSQRKSLHLVPSFVRDLYGAGELRVGASSSRGGGASRAGFSNHPT